MKLFKFNVNRWA